MGIFNCHLWVIIVVVEHYTYDNLYRLTNAAYTTGETYAYDYDPVGNRLQQVINGNTTGYIYDTANRIESVDGQSYTFDDNGNLLNTGVLTNTFDAANRLVSTTRDNTILQPVYNGIGDRVGQVTDGLTTTFALDVVLPEVIDTSEGNIYLHLPGIIVAKNSEGEIRYLLSDGLGSIRQATDDSGEVVVYNEFDPYGNPVENEGGDPYGYTGEWWEKDVGLLHLRARWYLPGDGVFLSRDRVESEPPYLYVRGNPANLTDPSGLAPRCKGASCKLEMYSIPIINNILESVGHVGFAFTDQNGVERAIDAGPQTRLNWLAEITSGNLEVIGSPLSSGWNPDAPLGKAGKIIARDEVVGNPTLGILEELRNSPWRYAFVTVAEGEDVCNAWRCIVSKLQSIQSKNIAYKMLGPNSNSAAYTTLKACKLPTIAPLFKMLSKLPWRSYPGWGIDLFNPPLSPLASTFSAPVPTPTN